MAEAISSNILVIINADTQVSYGRLIAVMDAISHKYTGKPFPWREGKDRVAIYLVVEKEKYSLLPFDPPA